jgi:hypothetical protein
VTDHIHDCTGTDWRCPCGYAFTVPSICVSIEVSDGSVELVNEGFNTNSIDMAIAALRKAADKLEAR